jgi:hypothetical protein
MLREAKGHSLFNPIFAQARIALLQGDLTSLSGRIHRSGHNVKQHVDRKNVRWYRRPVYDVLTSELGMDLATHLFQVIGMLYLGDSKIKRGLGEFAFNFVLMSEDACCEGPEINGNPHRRESDLPPIIRESVSAA